MSREFKEKAYVSYGRDKYSRSHYPRSDKKLFVKDDESFCPPRGMRRMLMSVEENLNRRRGVSSRHLEKILNSKLGESWDDVYSDLCKQINPKDYVGNEIKDYLNGWLLELNCIMVDGEVRDSRGEKFSDHTATYYVHPETNLLQKTDIQRRKWRPKEKDPVIFELDSKQFLKSEEIWYRVEMAEAPDYPRYISKTKWDAYCRSIANLKDAFLKMPLHYYDAGRLREKYGLSPNGKPWYCKKKESANSKEIEAVKKKYNL